MIKSKISKFFSNNYNQYCIALRILIKLGYISKTFLYFINLFLYMMMNTYIFHFLLKIVILNINISIFIYFTRI